MIIKSMMKGMLAVVMAMSRQHAPEHLQQTRLLLSHRHRHRQKVQQQQSRKPFMITNTPVTFTIPTEGEVEVLGTRDGGGGTTYAVYYEMNHTTIRI